MKNRSLIFTRLTPMVVGRTTLQVAVSAQKGFLQRMQKRSTMPVFTWVKRDSHATYVTRGSRELHFIWAQEEPPQRSGSVTPMPEYLFLHAVVERAQKAENRAFSSNFGKRPLVKIGKNDRLNIKIGRN